MRKSNYISHVPLSNIIFWKFIDKVSQIIISLFALNPLITLIQLRDLKRILRNFLHNFSESFQKVILEKGLSCLDIPNDNKRCLGSNKIHIYIRPNMYHIYLKNIWLILHEVNKMKIYILRLTVLIAFHKESTIEEWY